LNDYVLVGFEYGGSYVSQIFNPKFRQEKFIIPEYYGVTITKYCKMFGYMPYFGLQVGLMKGHEGFKFKPDPETGAYTTLEGTRQAIIDIIELPMLAQFHYDFPHFKLMATAGIYAGYRTSIERIGPNVEDEYRYSFRDYDNRFDYGLQGGAGFGIVFDPIEFHVNARVRYSWSSLFEPNYYSEYYYRYAFPFDIILTAGIHVQMSLRTGTTCRELKKEAKRIVYGEEN